MTKPFSRKTGKKGNGESVKKHATKTQKTHHQNQLGTSRGWMFGLGICCLLIGAVAVVLYVLPSFQVGFKENVSRGKDFREQKKVIKNNGVDNRKGKKKSAGKTRRLADSNEFSFSECDTCKLEKKHKERMRKNCSMWDISQVQFS